MKNRLVKDWMVKDVITISPDTTVPDASAIMRKKGIRRLPVVEDGVLVGIVSQTDVMKAKPSNSTTLDIWELNYLLSRLPVEKIMTTKPLTIHEDSTLKEVAQIMYDHKVGGVPVVDEDNHVVGIITESDIFRILIKWLSEDDK